MNKPEALNNNNNTVPSINLRLYEKRHATPRRTVTGGQWVAPEVVPLAGQRLLVAQAVARLAAVRHRGADGQVVAQPCPVHRDARVHAGVRVQSHDWKGRRETVRTELVWRCLRGLGDGER